MRTVQFEGAATIFVAPIAGSRRALVEPVSMGPMSGLNAFERQNPATGAAPTIAQSVANILRHHVKLSVAGVDRMYLDVYVPRLQTEPGRRFACTQVKAAALAKIGTAQMNPGRSGHPGEITTNPGETRHFALA